VTARELEERLAHLRRILHGLHQVAVAYSGGVDSSLLLKLAYDILGDRAAALTAVSASLPPRELEAARATARHIGARLTLIPTGEVEDPDYRANTAARCFHCKDIVYAALQAYARDHGLGVLVDGFNADDEHDHRPGRWAAARHGVRSPLAEAGLDKADIRSLARRLGLPNWDKPAMACLSSRVPHGTAIRRRTLERIQAAERVLFELGCRQARVRHYGSRARIEVEPVDFERVLTHSQEVVSAFGRLGYSAVGLDAAGYQPGGANPADTPDWSSLISLS
jgi:uncharacterized protein